MADANPSGNTPAAEIIPPTSGAGAQTPSQPSKEETVVLKKEDHDKLMQQIAHGATAQKEKAGLEQKLNAMLRRKVPALPPLEAQAIATVKSKVSSAVIADPKYAPLLQKNPTLAKVLAKNPLDLLEQDEFMDEDDATNQVLDYLDAEMAKNTEAPAAVVPAAPAAPAPSATNPDETVNPTELSPTQKLTKEQEEANAKLPPMKRITNTIASRLNFNAPSK